MDARKNPLVSIVIPVYNAEGDLRSALLSILNQPYSKLEVIRVDDGSTDDRLKTIANINDGRIRIIQQENRGRSIVLNRAQESLTGHFYAIQDADDISHVKRFQQQVEAMRQDPSLAAVFTGYSLIVNGRESASRFKAKDKDSCRPDIEQFRMPSHDPTRLFRFSMVRSFRYASDLLIGGLDYILRVGEEDPMKVLGECLYSSRVHYSVNDPTQPGSATRVCSARATSGNDASGLLSRSRDPCARPGGL